MNFSGNITIIDNDNQKSEYENNIKYSSFKNDMKGIIVLYFPFFYETNYKNIFIENKSNYLNSLKKE